MAFARQLKLLLWKNWKLMSRQPVRIVIELVWPLFLFLILAWVKLDRGLQEHKHECHYDIKAMPSAGPLPFFQSLACTANNTCHADITSGELPGMVDTYNASLLSQFFYEFEELLSDQSEMNALDNLIRDIEIFTEASRLAQNGQLNCTIRLGDVLIDPGQLVQTLQNQSLGLTPDVLSQLTDAALNTTAIFNILGELQSNSSGNVNDMSSVAEIVRAEICPQDRPQLFFTLPTVNLTTELVDELCNMTNDQFLLFVQDTTADIDYTELTNELSDCANAATGQDLSYLTNDTIQTIPDLAEAFQNLQSVETFLNQFNETFTDTLSIIPGLQNLDSLNISTLNVSFLSTNASRIVSRLVCGRDTTVFQADETDTQVAIDKYMTGTESETRPIEYDPSTTPFCNNLFEELNKEQSTRILWQQIKPIVRGKLPFTPNTPVMQRLVTLANGTFEELNRLIQLTEDWLALSPSLYDFLANSDEMNSARVLINLYAALNDDDPSAKFWSEFLSNDNSDQNAYNWKTAMAGIDFIMKTVNEFANCFELDKFIGFDSEDEMVAASLDLIDENKLWAGIVLDVNESYVNDLPSHVSYRIRMDTDRVDSTAKNTVLDRYWSPGPRDRPYPDMKYVLYGFVYIQDLLEHAIIDELTGDEQEDVGIYLQQFPYPCYIEDKFTLAISRSMPMFMVLAWIYSVSMIVKGIVYEKEQRLKEVMKVMGLSNGVHWLAWFIVSFIMMTLSVLLLVAVLKGGRVMEHTSASVIFVFLMAFCLSTITLCFFFSTLFDKANLAAACAALLYFMFYLPYAFCTRWEEYMLQWQKVLASLLAPVGFGFGCSYIARSEEQGIGMHWDNISDSPLPEDSYSLMGTILIMLLDSLIYWMLTWYIEAVFPGQYGIPKPWYFFATKAYWCSQNERNNYPVNPTGIEMNSQDSSKFEDEPQHLTKGVSVHNIKKIYKKGHKVAVDGLSINFYEGQITSFLGHNGAGKTTTMSILTGMFPPTEGTAVIYGQDIRYDMDNIRNNMGICPQHNVLFDKLTVEEHIWFYSQLKGSNVSMSDIEIAKMISEIGLPHKRKEPASSLSGGMKRKLSVGIAFTAGSKVVILDEPTAGVDPYARRSIWDLLLKYKSDRTIILSTHFMDEADILGDRIAIISQGKLRCCGSSLFLKTNFGSGYYLTMVRDENQVSPENRPGTACTASGIDISTDRRKSSIANDEGVDMETSSDGSSDDSPLTAFIKARIPDAKLVDSIGAEVTYQLPDDQQHTSLFASLFRDLDNNLSSLGISSYGVSDTTLEEIFLKVASEHGVDEESRGDEESRQQIDQLTESGNYARPVTRLSFKKEKNSFFGFSKKSAGDKELLTEDADSGISVPIELTDRCNGAGSYRVTGFRLILRQFMAIFIKRFHFLRRSKKAFISQVILPPIFICVAMIFAVINPPIPQEPPLELHPWHLAPLKMQDKHLYMFYSKDNVDNKWSSLYEELLQVKPGVGNRCMNASVYEINNYRCMSGEESQWYEEEFDGSPDATCSCTTGKQECQKGAAGPEPSKLLLHTTDYLYNMTGRNITEWLLKSNDDYIKKRYGGVSFGERDSLVRANESEIENAIERLLIAANGRQESQLIQNITVPKFIADLEALIENAATQKNAKVWFNNKGYVAMVAYMNVMNNLILRSRLPSNADPKSYGISGYNHPMNRTQLQLYDYTLDASVIDVLIAISVIFAMCMIPASFVLFLIEERVSGSKHLQFVSGVNKTVYWVANFCWDMLNYIVCAVICVFIFLAFNQESYVSSANAPCLVSLLFLYGFAVTPMMYPASHIFSVPSTAFVVLGCINTFLGIVSTLSTYILEALNEEDLDNINAKLMQAFLLFPHYCLGRGLIDMTRNQLIADVFAGFGEDLFKSPFSWDVTGRNLTALVCLGFLFFFINLAIEYNFWVFKLPCIKKCLSESAESLLTDEDVDVARERNRVLSSDTSNDILIMKNLTKVYKSQLRKKGHRAVDNLCIGVHKGECLGLLGVNGAGKTTTFKMLTGDLSVTAGSAHIAGYSILTEMSSVHQQLGYCPQFDALCSLLTPSEHLELYARLRGVPEEDVPTVAAWGIRRLGLVKHIKKSAHQLSGGNKRKLSTALALVGNPSVIFLDEPTTGMDPKARRFLWDCINNIIKDGRSVILTSHSMEECEALCNRIAIMVNGSFKCLGSNQHLKNRFGDGYMVTLRVTTSSGVRPDLQRVVEFMNSTFPGCLLKEQHHNMLQYQLPSEASRSLADIFGELEGARVPLSLEDYSVTQTTLDQVFINFARQQTDLLEDELQAAEATHHNTVTVATHSPTANGAAAGAGDAYMTFTSSSCTSLLPESRPVSANSVRPAATLKHGLNVMPDELPSRKDTQLATDTVPPWSKEVLPSISTC